MGQRLVDDSTVDTSTRLPRVFAPPRVWVSSESTHEP